MSRSFTSPIALVVALFAMALTAGCDYLDVFVPDSPSEFTIGTPVSVAASATSIIFKSPSESDNCVLRGGPVTLTAPGGSEKTPIVRLTYDRGDAATHGVARFETAAGVAAFAANGRFSLSAPRKPDV